MVITGTGDSNDVLRVGDTRGNRLTLTGAESLSANVLAGTKLDFSLQAPEGFTLAASPFAAGYQEKGDNTAHDIAPEHTDNSVVYTVPVSDVQKDRAITVNVYFAPQYRVIYDGNGNTGGDPPTDNTYYPSGHTLNQLAGTNTLKRTGYNFGGWSLSKTEPNAVSSVTFGDENITLYAIWRPKNTYTVTYHSTGHSGSVPEDPNNPYYEGDTVHVLNKGDMTKTVDGVNYVFKGWDTDYSADEVVYVPYDSNSPQSNSYFDIDHDTDLYAVWTARYTVTYDGNGSTGGTAPTDSNNPYDSGAEVTVLGNGDLVKTGCSFHGWSEISGADNTEQYKAGDKFAITQNTTLYAVWKVNTHKVIYSLTVPDDVNYTCLEEKTCAYGTEVSMAAKPTVSDYSDPLKYTFLGWNNTDNDLNMNAAQTSFVMPDHDVIFTGSFDIHGQSILVYNANGGQPADKVPPTESSFGSLATTVKAMPSECVKTGCTFDHWNTAQDDTGTGYSAGNAIEVPENNTTVLYAQWRVNSYPVEYYQSDGTTLIKQDVYPYNDTVTVGAQAPATDGKKFREWMLMDGSQTDANGTAIGERASFSMQAQTVRYKAVYDDLQYRVVYAYANARPDGAADEPTDGTSYAFGGTVNVRPVPNASSGYSFDGWQLGGSKTEGFTIGADTPATPVEGNDLLYTITLSGVWHKNGDVNITYTSCLSGNDITDELLRTVKYDTCTKGMDYTLKPNEGFTDYVRPGYDFVGWKVSTSGVQPISTGWLRSTLRAIAPVLFKSDTVYEVGSTIPALDKDITLAAVWQQNPAATYTVTYHGNENTSGDVPVDGGQYTAGSSAPVLGPYTLQKTGCEFDGWTTEPSSGDHYSEGDSITVNGNVHLYARWKEIGGDPAP